MIVKQYIKEFEKMGLGMFVHFGIYSVLESGEWAKTAGKFTEEKFGKYSGLVIQYMFHYKRNKELNN